MSIPKGWKFVQEKRTRVNPFPGYHYEKKGYGVRSCRFGGNWEAWGPEGKLGTFSDRDYAMYAVDNQIQKSN